MSALRMTIALISVGWLITAPGFAQQPSAGSQSKASQDPTLPEDADDDQVMVPEDATDDGHVKPVDQGRNLPNAAPTPAQSGATPATTGTRDSSAPPANAPPTPSAPGNTPAPPANVPATSSAPPSTPAPPANAPAPNSGQPKGL